MKEISLSKRVQAQLIFWFHGSMKHITDLFTEPFGRQRATTRQRSRFYLQLKNLSSTFHTTVNILNCNSRLNILPQRRYPPRGRGGRSSFTKTLQAPCLQQGTYLIREGVLCNFCIRHKRHYLLIICACDCIA